MGIKQRYRIAKHEWDFWQYQLRMQGGTEHDVYCLRCELEFDRMRGLDTIAPTDTGLWLICKWTDFCQTTRLVAFVLFGAYQEELDL
jgi:hypothetical protein